LPPRGLLLETKFIREARVETEDARPEAPRKKKPDKLVKVRMGEKEAPL